MIDFLKSPVGVVLLVLVVAIGAGTYLFFGGEKGSPYEFVIAERKDIVQEVSVTGRVKPAKALDLAFETAGRVEAVFAKVGDRVVSGQTLVQLDDKELQAKLLQTQASLKGEEAKLQELQRGTRPQELRVYEVKVENAQLLLKEAQEQLFDALQDSYTKADDAIRNKADQAFLNPRTADPQLQFVVVDAQEEINLESQRKTIEPILSSWKSSLDVISPRDNLVFHLSGAKENLSKIKLFLDKLALAITSAAPGTGVSQTTLDSWKTSISTARTNVNTATSNVQTGGEKLQTGESNLSLAKEELALKQAGASQEEISAQQAKMEQAQASLQEIQAKLQKMALFSPISGVVTKLDIERGELVGAAASILSLISQSQYEIEAFVPEVDVAKIKVGNTARVTLDAYGSSFIFEAEVVSKDPGETVLEGVPTYKTTLHFAKEGEGILPGMTANIDILTAKREGVFAVPQRAVIAKDGKQVLRLLFQDGTLKEQEVKTGIASSQGEIEILEGIKEGDKVIVFVKE